MSASGPVADDVVVELKTRIGLFPVTARCRVVYVIDAPMQRGFAYGTLEGHPESGAEAFVIDLRDDGTVTATVTAFSRPASRLAKLSGPIARHRQDQVTDRYLAALIQ